MGDLLASEVDAVRYRAAKFIIDENKGRNDANANKGKVNINILTINDRMAKAKRAIQAGREAKSLAPVTQTPQPTEVIVEAEEVVGK